MCSLLISTCFSCPNCLDILYDCIKFDYLCVYKNLLHCREMVVCRFMEEELRPCYVGTRLKLVVDSLHIDLVLQKVRDHFLYVLCLIQESK